MGNCSLREIFASNIKLFRSKENLSQEELANRCGLHRTYLSDIERGTRNISIDNIDRIAKALNVSPSILLKENDE